MKPIPLVLLALCACGAAAAQSSMAPAAGKWAVSIDGEHVSDECFDAKKSFGDLFKETLAGDPDVKCSKVDFKQAGAAIKGSLICSNSGTAMTSDITITGDLKTAYKAETVTRTMGQTVKMTINAKRIGGC